MLIKVTVPTDIGNERIKAGSLPMIIQETLSDLDPEAAYFVEDGGLRTGYIVAEVASPADIPAVAEPWSLAFGARVEFHPAMRFEDLQEAGRAIGRAVERYGKLSTENKEVKDVTGWQSPSRLRRGYQSAQPCRVQ